MCASNGQGTELRLQRDRKSGAATEGRMRRFAWV